MSTKCKPLYWRVGAGKWHEDTLRFPTRPMMVAEIDRMLRTGHWDLLALCGFDPPVADASETRRSAPPVADQCKHCRAAKARARKERIT